MREGHNARAGQLAPIERRLRLGPRYGRMLGRPGWLVAAALVVVLVVVLVDRPAELDCARAVRTRTPGVAMAICEREYRDTGDPATGVQLANLLRQVRQREAARTLANELLGTPERANAYQLLGEIAADDDQPDAAVRLLEAALTLHRAAHELVGAARDDRALAQVRVSRNQFSEALVSLDECLRFAADARDREIEFYCRLAAAKVLTRVGDFDLARRELAHAISLAATDRDRVWLEYQQGNLEQEVGRAPQGIEHNHRAIEAFEHALAINKIAQVPRLAVTIELNLAYTFAEAGRIDDAERHLELARLIDIDNKKATERTEIAARIAYRRGDPTLASSLNDRVYPDIDDADDRIDVAVMQARIALAGGDLGRAEDWARRGIADVENIRTTESVLELRSHVLSSRRAPYELLFVALARAGRVEDAVTTLDQWQGRTLLDALAGSSPRTAAGLVGAARRVANLGAWLPVVSTAPFGKPSDRRLVLDTLRTTDLLALVVADHEVWCVTASQGRLHVTGLGPLTRLQDRLDRFRVAPTAPALAGELGELFLRDGTFRATPAPLHVLLDGPLTALPIVALRRSGRPLIAVRPVVRVLRLPDAPCVASGTRARATVIADAGSNLPDARHEAEELARMLGLRGLETTSAVGAAATSASLFAAANSDVLHVAMHAEIDAGGGVLELNDREVSALEISARKLGPSLAMLSACGSASADDVELAGSLASAFLAAGSAQVVATLRPVSDAGARRLTTRFYTAGGIADPVHTLARVQAELAETGDTDWPSFAVFGHDVCSR